MARPNRGTRLEKNDRGIYEIRWSEDGRSKRVSTGTESFAEANVALGSYLHDLKRVKDERFGLSVTAVLDAYLTEHAEKKMVGQGPETARYATERLKSFFGGMNPLDIHPDTVREYTRKRLTGGLGRQVQAGTVRRELGVLIAAMNHAAAERRLKKADIPPIPLPDAPPPRDRWLTDAEVRRLFDAAAAGRGGERLSRVERFLHLAYYTAGRKEALETLTWAQVDWDTGMLHLGSPGRRVTKKRRASVPMHPTLRAVLERAKAEATGPHILDHAGSVRRTFTTAVAAAGLVDVTPHVMRHTAATHMLRRGVPIWKVAGILGDTVMTVQSTYGHHVPEALKEAVEALL